MTNPKRSDTATTADWSFIDRPEVTRGVDKIARKAAERGVSEFEDLQQDLYLWLAVRPGAQAKPDHLVVLDLRMEARAHSRKAEARAGKVDFVPLEEAE